jgi:hypothetical protein
MYKFQEKFTIFSLQTASTIKLLIFLYLSGPYVYTSLLYNFLIIVSHKHSITPTQHFLKSSKAVSPTTLHHYKRVPQK